MTQLDPSQRNPKRKGLLVIGGGIVVAAIVAFVVVYFVLFPTSSPKPLSLATATTTTPATPITAATTFNGSWSVAPSSVAGYRVREKLAFLPAESDAVGRTSEITGSATASEASRVVTITKASFDVNVASLKSNEAMRDQHIQTIGIQSATYPNATFALSTPLVLPTSALSGGVVNTTVTGVFNIHGTSKTETVPVQLRLAGNQIDVSGSLTFPWGEFNMTAPSVGGFVSVTNKATMEFDLVLQRS